MQSRARRPAKNDGTRSRPGTPPDAGERDCVRRLHVSIPSRPLRLRGKDFLMKRATTLAGVPGFGGPAHPRCFSRLFVVPPRCKTAFWRAGARQGRQ